MQIQVNGHAHTVEPDLTVATLLDILGYANKRVAVEINHCIVPRSQHAEHRLTEQDHIEIVQAIGGG